LTEFAARLAGPRASQRVLSAVVLLAGLVLVTAGAIALRPHPAERTAAAPADPVGLRRGAAARADFDRIAASRAVRARHSAALAEDAALGLARGLFTSNRGGIVAAAARATGRRSLIVRAARGSGFGANALEAIFFVDHHAATARTLRRTVRFLVKARRRLGRRDLALEAHALGIGTLRHAIAAYGRTEPTYAELYFGSTPNRHAAAWSGLAAGGDYYWQLLAAERILRLYRHHPAALAYEAHLQARKNSAEEAMHPRPVTPQFRTPDAIARAWRHHILRTIPHDSARTHLAVSRFLGQEAHALGRSRRLYVGLRPQALDVLLYIGRRVHELSGARKPLLVSSAVRDDRYQRVLQRVNANAARAYSMHTTGYAFDIERTYASRRQAAAFQFVLDRLTAVGAIAYIHEYAAIHIAAASDAKAKLALLGLG
jgi:hypothetical protein